MGAVTSSRRNIYSRHEIEAGARKAADHLEKKRQTMNIARSFNNWRKYRETVSELGRMTDRELNDLGIGRADIRRVARTAVGF
jgi:uncharacterized protein YjiS (DUF1127 family)